MADISYERILEMVNDVEDYETEWTKFETEFILSMKDNLDKYQEKFKFFGNQQKTFQNIYDKYIKKVDR